MLDEMNHDEIAFLKRLLTTVFINVSFILGIGFFVFPLNVFVELVNLLSKLFCFLVVVRLGQLNEINDRVGCLSINN